jgi:hypothetical protein
LRAQLKAALKSRAMVYSAVHDEISKEFGEAAQAALEPCGQRGVVGRELSRHCQWARSI